MDNFSDAISSLNNLAVQYDIFVPSVNRKIKFKGLNTKQQKEAVKSALETGFIGVSFSNFLNTIIKDNACENVEFLLTDKNFIITCLRVLSLSKDIKIDNTAIDFSFILNNAAALPEHLKQKEISDNNLKVNLQVPSLTKDTEINRETAKKIGQDKSESLSKEAVGEMFINELVKYIDKISIDNNGKIVELNFKDVTFEQKVQLVEKLPLTLNSKIFDYINEVRNFEKTAFIKDGKQLDLTIDPSFFTV